MAVLSNNGRLINTLQNVTSFANADEFIIQSSGITKKGNFSNLRNGLLYDETLTGVVTFNNSDNEFTGSFNGNFYNGPLNYVTLKSKDIRLGDNSGTPYMRLFYDVINGESIGTYVNEMQHFAITRYELNSPLVNIQGGGVGVGVVQTDSHFTSSAGIIAKGGFTGSISGAKAEFDDLTVSSFSLPGTINADLNGNVTSTGTSTFNILTSDELNGPLTGSLEGDIYTTNGDKVLENGTSANGGGVPDAYFYGTASFANETLSVLSASWASSSLSSSYTSNTLSSSYALTASYLVGGSTQIPSGGSQYQVLTKGTGNTVGWGTPITRSGANVSSYVTMWHNSNTLTSSFLRYLGTNFIFQKPVTFSVGFTGTLTGSFVSNTNEYVITTGNESELIRGDTESSNLVELSASGYITMSLFNGQTSTVLVKNTTAVSGPHKILKWSGSLDGVSATEKIYWRNGNSASITQANSAKDVITFVNIDNKIFGTVINNFS